MDRWAINIDIEGFSILWDREDQVLWSLGELMRAIFRIGRECFPDSPERLFSHQIGDGFLVVSDFGEESLERAVTVAVALMQHVAASGRLTKAAIAEGELGDIQGCYPRGVLDELEADHTVSLHMGLMTIFPVMGTALIRAVKVAELSPSGPLLLIEKLKADRVPECIPRKPVVGTDLVSIDWVHTATDQLISIQKCVRLSAPKPAELEAILQGYCKQFPLKQEWVNSVREYLGVNGV
jgi:hypothetical protein